MDPWLKRLITILAGVGVGALGVLVPVTAPFALPAAGLLAGMGGQGWLSDRAAAKAEKPAP